MNHQHTSHRGKMTTLLLAALSLLIALPAMAEKKKYIITLDSSQTYQTLKAAKNGFSTFGSFAPSNSRFHFLNNAQEKVKEAFDNLEMVVIETDNLSEIEFLRESGMQVEEEMILPEPDPIVQGDSAFAMSAAGGPVPRPWGIDAVNAPDAWQASNYGEGTRVLVLDTGIDKDHPALASRFEKGKNFMARTDNPAYEFQDMNGHGTHVAGTIAADGLNGAVVGVAPKAKILSGRVCSGGCSTIAIIAGVDWGIDQQVDVMNLSLGGPFASAAARQAYARAEAADIVVVAASGNDGNGRISYPAAFPTTVAVGAVDSKLEKAKFSQWGPELSIVAPGVEVNSSVPQGSGRMGHTTVTANNNGQKTTSEIATQPMSGSGVATGAGALVTAGLGKPEDVATLDLTGKVALIQRGEISFLDKVNNAVGKGAVGVIVYNNEDGMLHGTLGDGNTSTVPAVGISKEDGEKLVATIQSATTTEVEVAVDKTDYSELQGTSMASPHVAGVVALIRASNPTLSAAEIRTLLATSATKLTGDNSQNQLGAGLVNADAAVSTSLLGGAEFLLTGTN